ncbi:hypothetical protein ACJX0J_025514, partial [Zea mays]
MNSLVLHESKMCLLLCFMSYKTPAYIALYSWSLRMLHAFRFFFFFKKKEDIEEKKGVCYFKCMYTHSLPNTNMPTGMNRNLFSQPCTFLALSDSLVELQTLKCPLCLHMHFHAESGLVHVDNIHTTAGCCVSVRGLMLSKLLLQILLLMNQNNNLDLLRFKEVHKELLLPLYLINVEGTLEILQGFVNAGAGYLRMCHLNYLLFVLKKMKDIIVEYFLCLLVAFDCVISPPNYTSEDFMRFIKLAGTVAAFFFSYSVLNHFKMLCADITETHGPDSTGVFV